MKFYDREKEIALIRSLLKRKNKKASITVLTGRRRIGKTRLVLEALKDQPFLYFFVGRKKMPDLLKEWQDEYSLKIRPAYGQFQNFNQFIAFLFQQAKSHPITVFFDEIQNLTQIEPGAFSDLQKHYDLNKETSSLILLFAGSMFTVVEKIFAGAKEPLFGRADQFIHLAYLPLKTQKLILQENGFGSGEDLLHAFTIFDGIPRFYEEVVERKEKGFKETFKRMLLENEFIWDEGLSMLREEFGSEYAIYHSVLAAIATGNRSRNDIESALQASAGGYLDKLEKLYKIIKKERSLFPAGKTGNIHRYYFSDNFFEFWFRFISRYQALREINQRELAFEKIWQSLPQYEGFKLEGLIKRLILEVSPFDFKFNYLGRYWDRQGQNEIDLIMVNEEKRCAYIVDIKRNLQKVRKKSERSKLLNKISTIPQLKDYRLHFFEAGLLNNKISLVDSHGQTFTL